MKKTLAAIGLLSFSFAAFAQQGAPGGSASASPSAPSTAGAPKAGAGSEASKRAGGGNLAARDRTFVTKAAQAGLAEVEAATSHVVLESASFQLVLHGIPPKIAKGISISTPPKLREDVPVKLFFPVPSLSEARARAQALGGGLAPPAKEWEARGFRACDGHDPEGNVIQLREEAPERLGHD